MAYDQAKAELYNQLVTQGVPPIQAAQQAGISYLQLVNAQRQEGDGRGSIDSLIGGSDYRLGSNGLIGPRNPSPTPPAPAEVTQNDPTTVTVTSETVTVPVDPDLPTPTVVDRLIASERNSAEADAFLRTAQPNYAFPGPTPVTPNNYTTTSTVTVSGGGVTTVIATPSTPTPASQRAQAEADATLREIEALQLENSGFGPGPQLTEAQMQANDARILQLTEQYDRQRAAATSSAIPGEPSVTTVPNTTTTTRTTVYETSAENNPVSALDPQVSTLPSAASVSPATETNAQPAVDPQATAPAADPLPDTGTAAQPAVDPQATAPAADPLPDTGTTPVPATDPYAVDQGTEAFITAELEEPPVVGRNVTTAFNPETGLYDVVDLDSGEVLAQDRSELEAQIDAAELEAGDPAALTDDDINEAFLPESDIISEPTEADAAEYGSSNSNNLSADLINNQIDSPDNTGERERDTLQAAQNIRELRQQSTGDAPGDWRVRLRLAPLSTYLYNDPDNTLLKPLAATDGVIFPYTPQISTVYHANYNQYDLTHSNYRGYFYQNSYVGEVQIQAAFTAQDTKEAEYLLAVIHFFRSATKMFYGGGGGKPDEQIGSPPPLVFLSGLGDYQFAEHPCVISQFNYNLPNDVDYLRVASPSIVDTGTNTQNRRSRDATTPTGIGSLLNLAGLSRLAGIGAQPGGSRPITVFNPGNLSLINGSGAPTYVPSKIDISLVLLPMQSRKNASQQASLRDFAAGNLLKGGFW